MEATLDTNGYPIVSYQDGLINTIDAALILQIDAGLIAVIIAPIP